MYFCCNACATRFWREPGQSIVGAGPESNSIDYVKYKQGDSKPTVAGPGDGYGATFVMASILVTSVLSVVAFAVLTKTWRNSVPLNPPSSGRRTGGVKRGGQKNKGFDRLEAQSGEDDHAELVGMYCDDETDTI